MIEAPIILSIETATLGGSIFIARGDTELAARTGDPNVSHSNNLLHDINETLSDAAASLNDVQAFACASGPGSFTGLRIGIATVKALAVTLGRPVIGIPTLKAVAHAAGPSSVTIAALPAGRGEVFAQMFSVGQDEVVKEIDEAAHLSPEKLLERYGGLASRNGSSSVIWAGGGAHVQQQVLEDYAHRNHLTFAEQGQQASPSDWLLAPNITNLAKHVGALALQEFQHGNLQSPHSLSAIYVRPSDAELKQQCR